MGILPKLNDTPNYTMTIPSTGETIGYRPYLVKEEKVMLMANETGDQKQVMEAMANTIRACCDEKVDVPTLTTFDVEYMFTQIRAKSVGEKSNISVKCQSEECDGRTEVTIDLTQVDMSESDKNNIIELTPEISIELSYPSYVGFLNNYKEGMSESEFAFLMLEDCIVAIITEEERILTKDVNKKELKEFIDSMSSKQFQSVGNYLSTAPKMKKDVEFECSKCGKENKVTLEGLQDFF